ncbi:MAG: MBL fold metallo-hydrolase [Erysipelotrichaceae bacterium]|nr:MBL fold metallo-hydrolase [Erysipelotrichaceae bacterium]
MRRTNVSIRPFNVGCNFQLVLPNGTTILIDPWFTGNEFPGGFTREDITAADYIILTHAHFDHDLDVGYFVRKFNSKVFVGALSALDILKFHRIPYDNIFPVFPNSKFTLDEFTIDFYQAKHNPSGGRTWNPEGIAPVEGHEACDTWGSMESLDFLLTTKNNFRILCASGRVVWNDLFDICREKAPDMLLRQAGVRKGTGDMKTGQQVSPEELAQLMVRYGAQTIFPFHHDVLIKRQGLDWVNHYMDQVAAEVERIDAGAQFVNPVACRWYSIGSDVISEEEA